MDEAVQPVIKMTVENSFIHLPFDILVVPYCSMRVSDQRVDMAPKSRIGKAKIAGTMSITVTAPPSAKSQFARGHRYRQWEGSPRHDLIVQLLLRFGRMCSASINRQCPGWVVRVERGDTEDAGEQEEAKTGAN